MPTPDSLPSFARIVELETRQDEVLRQLDELNQRIEQALKEWSPKAAQATRELTEKVLRKAA